MRIAENKNPPDTSKQCKKTEHSCSHRLSETTDMQRGYFLTHAPKPEGQKGTSFLSQALGLSDSIWSCLCLSKCLDSKTEQNNLPISLRCALANSSFFGFVYNLQISGGYHLSSLLGSIESLLWTCSHLGANLWLVTINLWQVWSTAPWTFKSTGSLDPGHLAPK